MVTPTQGWVYARDHLFLLLGERIAELKNLRGPLRRGLPAPPPPPWQDLFQPPVHRGDDHTEGSQNPSQRLRSHLVQHLVFQGDTFARWLGTGWYSASLSRLTMAIC